MPAEWNFCSRHGGLQVFIWVILTAWMTLIANLVNRTGNADFDKLYLQGGCTPADDFVAPYHHDYNKWDFNKIFQITVSFGTLPFSKAKLIDVAWDVVIGRGGQGLLIVIAYTVFTGSLVRIMENSAVSYRTFMALTFETATLKTIFSIARDFWTNVKLRAKLAIFWILLGSIWIATFPTYISAMSGYAANVDEYITDKDQNLVQYKKFQRLQYIIHDGWRIGLEGDHQIVAKTTSRLDYYHRSVSDWFSSPYDNDTCGHFGSLHRVFPNSSYSESGEPIDDDSPKVLNPDKSFCRLELISTKKMSSGCLNTWEILQYRANHVLNFSKSISSTFNHSNVLISLTKPSLNISAFYEEPADLRNCGDMHVDTDYLGLFRPETARWGYNNATYDLASIQERGKCAQNNTYRWGFSFLLLFFFCVIQGVWFIGMYIMWMDTYLQSRYHRAGRDMGIYRAAVDFSNAMVKDMGETITEEVSDTELRRRVHQRKLNGGKLFMEMLDQDHSVLPMSRANALKIWWKRSGGFKERVNAVRKWNVKRKCWTAISVLSVIGVIVIFFYFWIPRFLFSLIRGSWGLYTQ